MRRTLEQIAGRVCQITGYTIDNLRSRSRERDVASARQLFCYFAHKDGCSYSVIGRFICRDNVTVRYSYMLVDAIKDTDVIFKQLIERYMSEKKQIIELTPPNYDSTIENSEFTGFACTKCAGRGWLHDWGATRDEKGMYDCPRCGGSGKLKATVQIVWSADKMERKEQ